MYELSSHVPSSSLLAEDGTLPEHFDRPTGQARGFPTALLTDTTDFSTTGQGLGYLTATSLTVSSCGSGQLTSPRTNRPKARGNLFSGDRPAADDKFSYQAALLYLTSALPPATVKAVITRRAAFLHWP